VLRTFSFVGRAGSAGGRFGMCTKLIDLFWSAEGGGMNPPFEALPNIPQFMGVTVCGVDYNGL